MEVMQASIAVAGEQRLSLGCPAVDPFVPSSFSYYFEMEHIADLWQ